VGVDLVDVAAFEARFAERGALLEEVFTEAERAYCDGQRRPWPHLAARFAAKEALLKALRSGLTGAMRWRDIEVARDPAGTPRLVLSGATLDRLTRERLTAASVSLSHTESHAIAVVVLVAA
jgi:holo-[acyl-carrier protein] synthase